MRYHNITKDDMLNGDGSKVEFYGFPAASITVKAAITR